MNTLNQPDNALLTRASSMEIGKGLRKLHPLEDHAHIKPRPKGFSSNAILERSNEDRLAELIPIRYGRMLVSPFTYLRGSAALMADDLSRTPSSGIYVEACGDCHLLNFGAFATPERKLVFDINDFDETLPAPWEWDVKRLATSFVVSAQDNGLDNKVAQLVAKLCVQSYREHLRQYSKMSPLELWYQQLELAKYAQNAPDKKTRLYREELIKRAESRVAEYLFPKITTEVDGRKRLIDEPPLIFHQNKNNFEAKARHALEAYRQSLPDDRRYLLDRYHLEDIVVKVVGIGSVGTRCFIALFMTTDGQPLLLQAKEARPSVLEPYAGKSQYANHGQRVVVGQRLTQSSSDIFLGWARGPEGRDFYVRQLRDMKVSFSFDEVTPSRLKRYAEYCGQALARSHAKSGNAAMISGYLGKSDVFDEAVSLFAMEYAKQNEKDYQSLLAAVDEGKIKAVKEPNP
ncbi:MAG: hypothetical protein B7Y05_07020 [Polynucleobacter sp. 24-46-87]|jgi:uncharacterized protein (DUF2252 family)|nr:MAG: hypothetical protein B7Y55_00865 [Polynucleobacter sp. 35-46-207]OZA14558.1 MAG: hypothetical protein B7Y05_07020 [Polynucleobacter sp. 24-46-87]OZA42001.1 MAG: hypothetical protein B7X83_00665 [Polynucleobacter sp. 17-46-58]OZB49057.1 MAG: hypothetical protein B7X60_02380 [Polynucleobacter sp. 39-45-136]HQR84923.1 DUF2252 domain-containing protein [Polynucleobacter sp.]